MKVKLNLTSHGRGEMFFNDEPVIGVRSIHIDVGVKEINRVVVEYIPEVVEFEGEADVIAVVNGRRYSLIEDEPIPKKPQTAEEMLAEVILMNAELKGDVLFSERCEPRS